MHHHHIAFIVAAIVTVGIVLLVARQSNPNPVRLSAHPIVSVGR